MICPKCNSYNVYVHETKMYDTYIRRRRKCKDCGYIFKTYELIADRRFKTIKGLIKMEMENGQGRRM